MTTAEFYKFCIEFYRIFSKKSPYDTGNLRHNAIIIRPINNRKVQIYIDDVIAPYVYYTNEPWVSPRWHGKTNPNEGWIEQAIEETLAELASDYKGVVEVND